MPSRFALFPTAWGSAAIAWTDLGIAAVVLPHPTEAEAHAEVTRRLPEAERCDVAVPAFAHEAMRRITEHLSGAPQRFDDLPLDFSGAPAFHRKVWEMTRSVLSGNTASYGELAEKAGSPGAARAVGQAMAQNRVPLIVPCHRVLAADKRPGGFSAAGGVRTKEKLLALEGVNLVRRTSLFEGDGRLHGFDGRVAVRRLKQADSKLAALMEQVGPFRLQVEAIHSPFESLFEAIVYQQLTAKAAATILGRVKALFAAERFPTPDETVDASEEQLRGAGLSRGKLLALKDLAAKALDGTVPAGIEELERMSDEAIIERLTQVRGIGRWTVEMMLIFRLGRPDVLPIHDYGVRKGFAVMLGRRAPATPSQLERRGESWRPFRTVASWYLWRALELPPRVAAR